MSKIYVLQKDLPDSKAGDEYIFIEKYNRYYKNGDTQDSYWTPEWVHFNQQWFKEKDEKIKIEHLKLFDRLSGTNKDEFWYQFAATKRLDFVSADRIMRMIEFLINSNPPKLYTEEDMRNCFIQARLMRPLSDDSVCQVYKDCAEYINSINK